MSNNKDNNKFRLTMKNLELFSKYLSEEEKEKNRKLAKRKGFEVTNKEYKIPEEVLSNLRLS